MLKINMSRGGRTRNPFSTLVFWITIVTISSSVHAAKVQLFSESRCTIDLVGEIDAETPRAIQVAYYSLKFREAEPCEYPSIRLNSGGGNLEAAIEAGLFLREKNAFTIVPLNATCASACVLMYLAGVHRGSVGQVGIHRPYSQTITASPTDSKKAFERINGLIRGYLRQINIPSTLVDAMNAVPPSEVRWLSPAERKQWNIDGSDPIFHDLRVSKTAKRLKISKKEVYAREQRVWDVCGSETTKFMECYRAVMSGVR